MLNNSTELGVKFSYDKTIGADDVIFTIGKIFQITLNQHTLGKSYPIFGPEQVCKKDENSLDL